ncbi:DUF6371 domain-containing protein [Dysgonomonas termitidis]|uniref:DUF6371 domain-containing protein n=1 Tax=Dysgonomonas termitidis TaxID=1516126 RepID=A0ABV9L223_9BACT
MYKLEKYINKSQKHECPACGKRSFVHYVDEANKPLYQTAGRCDREDSCGYHYTPKEYFADNPADRDLNPPAWKGRKPKPVKMVTPQPIGTIPMKYIFDGCKNRNSDFVNFLFCLFDWETIKDITDPYFIGCTKNRAVIFPQIDEQGKCRTAKIQKYNPETGNRIKDEPGAVNWMHSILKKKGELPGGYNLRMCLFGLHLIRSERNKGKVVCICESEKSAVIASGAMPEYLWMAAGALGWLNIDKLKPLRDRCIILFPDTSATGKAFEKWTQIADEARSQGYDIHVSTMLEDECSGEQKERGYDIGDYLIDNRLRTAAKEKPERQLSEAGIRLAGMQKLNPVLTLLIDKLDLEVINN